LANVADEGRIAVIKEGKLETESKKAVPLIRHVFRIHHIHQFTQKFGGFTGTAFLTINPFFIQFFCGFRTLEKF
jgi:hypothetical protein